jgi:hypothetical protein
MSAKHFEHFMNHWQQLAQFQRRPAASRATPAVQAAKAKLRSASRAVRS